MKSRRKDYPESLKSQIEWAEKISTKEVTMMLLDGKSKTSCGCEVMGEAFCPHDNMGALQLLLLQYTNNELDELKSIAESKTKR
jgi:hypothetical protein